MHEEEVRGEVRRWVKTNFVGPDDDGLWLEPGMEFRSRKQWWGNEGIRPHPHLGVDLPVGLGRLVRAIFPGRIEEIIPHGSGAEAHAQGLDLVARTILIQSDIVNASNEKLVVMYGHLDVAEPIDAKYRLHVDANTGIGFVANAPAGAHKPRPHLHLTLAWASGVLTWHELNWNAVGTDERAFLRAFSPL